MGKLLVTGATGTVGSEVVNQLVNRQVDFRVLVRSEEKAKPFKERNINTAIGHYEDRASLTKALEDITGVFLISPPSMQQIEQEPNMTDGVESLSIPSRFCLLFFVRHCY